MDITVYIKRLLLLSFLFIGFISHANANANANANDNFEFGVLSDQNCIVQSCTISFDNTYTSPLVFLLSSFDTPNYTTDVSSALFIESVSSTKAVIRQKTRTHAQSKQIQMSSIQYVVIEEGVSLLDPTQPTMFAEAGVISGVSYIGTEIKKKHWKWLDIDFKTQFTRKPIVFTQLQGLSQANVWATTANSNVSRYGFKAALELGHSPVIPANNKPEKIAYLAIQEFSGMTENGASFFVGKKENVNQTTSSSNHLNALLQSCQNNIVSLPSSFDSDYGVLMSKQTRQGSDGGWLRLCEGQQNNKLSFMFDEDQIIRKHGALETVGYFVFENLNKIVIPPQQCDAFNGMQTWKNNDVNLITMENNAKVIGAGAVQGQVRFTNEIVNKYLGFSPETPIYSGLCDGVSCSLSVDNELPELLNLNWMVSSDARIINGYDSNMDNQKEFIRSTYFKNPYGVGNSQGYSGFYVKNSHTILFKGGEYWFDDMSVLGNIEIEGDVIFHVQDKVNFAKNVNANNGGTLFIYSYKDEGCRSTIDASPNQPMVNRNYSLNLNSNANVNGYIYTKGSMTLANGAKIKGAVTACQIEMNNNTEFIHEPLTNCGSEEYKLVISPTFGKGLACDGIAIDFSLVNSNGDLVDGVGQELFVTSSPVSGNTTACWSNDGNITTPECNHSSDSEFRVNFPTGSPATVTRYIHSKFLNSYNIQAMVNSENLTEIAGPYEFIAKAISIVPSEGVDGSNSNQVAARPFPFRLKIRGKENSNGNQLNCKVIKEDINLNVIFSHSKQPISSSKNLEISYNNGRWETASNNILISFEDGIAGGDENGADGTLLAKFDDAGIINLTAKVVIQGDDFTTSEQFYFRPFTAALCDSSSALPSYIDEESGAYLASGTDFNTYLKAVNWIRSLDSGIYGDGIPDRNEPSLVCSKTVTPSYITHGGGIAKLSLSSQLIYPVSGVVGVLTADGLPITTFSKEITNLNKDLPTVINWNEVGTLNFDAFQNNYFNRAGFNIPSTISSVGRFYPAYFTITDTLWDHPEKQGSSEGTYTYMAQPFDDVNFAVTAYSESDTTVNNYGLFDTSIKASFSLTGDYNERLNIASSDLDNTHWSNATWETPDLSKGVIWSRKSASTLAGNITTTADGPFNDGVNAITTALNLAISGVDPVSFDKTQEVLEQELLSQPKVRYGRMVLDSVGTSAGQSVIVPLRVEFWNGGRFVVNDTDSKSSFDGEKHEKQTIWPDPTKQSSSKLIGRGVIVNGNDSISLIAEPDSRILREQVRFWLCLDPVSSIGGGPNVNCQGVSGSNEEQPWLQYNWRGQGDEDPSTVVTFGIYRGNDRILFRGESNIIGTSN